MITSVLKPDVKSAVWLAIGVFVVPKLVRAVQSRKG